MSSPNNANERTQRNLMDEFPGNSHKSKESAKPEKHKEKVVTKVVTSEVVERKKPFGRKMKEIFFGGEFKSAGSYIVAEVLLPALRNLAVDATTKGVERMIYGDAAPKRPQGYGRPRVQYNSPIDRYSSQRRGYLPGESARVRPARKEVNDIIFETYEDAESVIEGLAAIIEQYELASVADLKALVGLPTTYVDNNWGWSDIRMIDIRQTREGWILDLPRTEPLG